MLEFEALASDTEELDASFEERFSSYPACQNEFEISGPPFPAWSVD